MAVLCVHIRLTLYADDSRRRIGAGKNKIPHCVFGVGVFAGSSVWKVSLFHFLAKPPLLGFNIFTFYRVALVVLFPTKLDSLDSDFICKSYGSSGFLMDLDRRWSGVSGPPESPAQRTRNLRSCVFRCQMPSCGAVLDWGPEVPRRWTGVSGPPESPAQGTRNLRPQIFFSSFASSWCGTG